MGELLHREVQMRPSAAKRGYGTRWRRKRRQFLADNPWCEYCLDNGRHTLATVVDHIEPHKGNPLLFWSPDNWQPLCKACHDSVKQLQERGQQPGCRDDGTPLDPEHPWNKTTETTSSPAGTARNKPGT